MLKSVTLLLAAILLFLAFPAGPYAEGSQSEAEEYSQRMALYKKTEAVTRIPWYFLAAVDQYERSVRRARKDRPEAEGLIAVFFSPAQWSGPLNPNQEDTNPASIGLFGGMGKDGNGDGKAEQTNDEDVLYTLAHYLEGYGHDDDNFTIALWEYYNREQAVNIVMANALLFKTYNRIDLVEHAFPVPLNVNYSYRSTWGDRRGWGGLRIHEGTDIFADYGVPVRATGYGVIEMKGWNRFGGWRIGIRDINNNYHYFAHLRGFADGIKEGQTVKPGTVIGYVGSSGYGKPGTQGKFPPHLHYGIYRDNGAVEWSYDPYPYLKVWERKERQKNK